MRPRRLVLALATLIAFTVCSIGIYSKYLSYSCCDKIYKDCLACINGTTVDDFCSDYPKQFGCGPRIMLAMIVSDKRGYVKFASDMFTQYHNVKPRDVILFDSTSLGFNKYTLRKWFGDVNVTSTNQNSAFTTITPYIISTFVNSIFDVLFLANTNVILHKSFREFISEHIMDDDGVLSLFNSDHLPKNCDHGLCEVQSSGQSGIAITKGVARLLLKEQNMSDKTFDQTFRNNNIRIKIPKSSLLMYFGRFDDSSSCMLEESPHKLSLCNFPRWIQDGYKFYQEECSDPDELYVKKDKLPRTLKTENFRIAVLILSKSLKYTETCLASIFETKDPEFEYTVYVAMSKTSHSLSNRKKLKKYATDHFFVNTIGIDSNLDTQPMNSVFSKAYSDGNDYIIYTDESLLFRLIKGVSIALHVLTSSIPTNVGIVSSTCEECDSSTAAIIVSRLHYDIFGFFIPKEISIYHTFSWLQMTYSPQHSTILDEWIVEKQSHLSETKKYDVKELNEQVDVGQKILEKWLKPVVSFCLYGSNIRYTGGAIENMKLTAKFFPEWQMWVYHDNTVPEKILKQLCKNGVTLIDMTNFPIQNQMSWRFLVASEPVTRFIIRDIDSRLSKRDKAAVDEWVASNKKFHVLRDHPNHAVWAMNGGMWGGTGDAIPNLKSLLLAKNPSGAYIEDMNFLNNVVWNYAKHSVMQHDELSGGKFGETRPFPLAPEGKEFVGDVYINGTQF